MTPPSPDLALPAAVLWDMDGTIVDTEPYWIAEEHQLVGEAGGVWTEQDAHDLVGQDLLVSAGIILERTPVTGTPEQVVDRLMGGVIRRIHRHVPWQPGAQQLLAEAMARGVPSALVTMSWTPLADVLVDRLPAGTFAAVVTGEQVTRGKPHPDAYLEAARRLGVRPQDCLAVEDSPTGAAAATSAGVPTIVVPHTVPVPQLPGAVRLSTLDGLGLQDLVDAVRGVRA